MSQIGRSLAAAALVVAAVGGAAQAANVSVTSGAVLVNTGSGYKPLASSGDFGPGTKVMAKPGGHGTITYSDGCRARIEAGHVITIADVSPCSAGHARHAAHGAGAALGATGLAPGAIAVGVGVAVGGGVLAYSASQKRKPASP